MHIHVLRRRAFTVLELLVVVVIFGILATLMLLKFSGASEKAMMAAMQNDLRNFATARALHLAEESGSSITGAASLPNFSFSSDVFEVGYVEEGAEQWAMVAGHSRTGATCSISTLDDSRSQQISCSDEQDMGFSANAHGPMVEVSAESAIQSLAFAPAAPHRGAAWAAEPDDIALISWNWGDGEVTSGPAEPALINTSHTYESDGDYTITLTLVKKSGDLKSGTREVTAKQAQPGDNLIVNGDGAFGGFNFSSFGYVPEPAEGAAGYFQVTTSGARAIFLDQAPFAIDTTKSYRIEALVRAQSPAQDKFYIGFKPYDIDGNAIVKNSFLRRADTRLAQPLTPGDEIVYLVDATGWRTDGNATYSALTIWNYRSASGHDYGEYTYSRRFLTNAWGAGDVDIENNTIRLKRPFPASLGNPDHPQGIWPAGQAVSNGFNGATYHYCAASNALFTSSWTRHSGIIQGVERDGNVTACKLPPGTAKIAPVFLVGYGTMNGLVTRDFADVRITELP